MKKLTFNKRYIGYYIICISLFFMPSLLRQKIFTQSFENNILFYLGFILLITKQVVKTPLKNKDNRLFTKIIYIFMVLLCSLFLIFIKGNDWSMETKIRSIIYFVFPSFILFSSINATDQKRIIAMYIKMYRIIVYSFIIFFVADKLLNNAIQNFFVSFYNSDTLKLQLSLGRFVSFYGHPLVSTNFILFFLISTLIIKHLHTEEYINRNLFIFDIFMSITGILITGSKSAFILGFFAIFILFIDKKNYKYFIPIVMITVILYYLGAFDIILDRLYTSYLFGDLSTGRNIQLRELMKNGTLSFAMLTGHNIGNNKAIIIALEYPLLRIAFRNGICVAVIMCIMYFLYPIKIVLARKNIKLLVFTLCYMAFINIQDGIASFGDSLIIYSINMLILITLINRDNYKNNNGENNYGEN